MFKLPVGCYEAPLPMSKEQSCAASGRPAAAERLEKVAHEAAPSLGPEPRPTSRSGRIDGGRRHRAPVSHIGVAAQAAGHRLRGGAARTGRGGRLPGGGLERRAVRADTARGHTDRRDRVQGVSHQQPPALSVYHPVWLCIHRSCIHPYSHRALPSIDRDHPSLHPSLCPPSQAPSAMSRFERKLIPCRCARARASGQLSECVSACVSE